MLRNFAASLLTTTMAISGNPPVKLPIEVQSIAGEVDLNDCRTDVSILPDDGETQFFALSYSFSKQLAVIRINGVLHKLKPIETRPSHGQKSTANAPQFIWANEVVRVEVFFSSSPQLSGNESGKSEYSESEEFSGKMIVKLRDSVRSYKIKGESGC